MLDVPARRKFVINDYEKRNDGIFFYTGDFTLRIVPCINNIFRISLTDKDEFDTTQGEHLKNIDVIEYSVKEDENGYVIKTDEIDLCVNKFTCSVKALDKTGKVIFSEIEKDSKEIERYEAFRTKQSDSMKVEKIKTADGEKNKILASEVVSDGFVYRTMIGLQFDDDEVLVGLGQFEEGIFNLRHTTQYLHQANRKIVSPLLVSSRGYGLMLTTQSTAIFRDDEYGSHIFCEADEYLDYYLILQNNPEDIIKGMRLLSGKAKMLPKWAYGYLQSKERYESQKEILDIADEFKKRGIGVDALILDWMSWGENLWGQKSFDLERFPDPKGMVEKLHEKGIHFMMSIWPNMAEVTDDYNEFKENGQLLPGTNIYNAYSKEGRAIYQKQLREHLLIHNVDAFWCDSSEPITPEWNNWFKKDPASMYGEYVKEVSKSIPIKYLNSYGLNHAKTIYEEMIKNKEKRVCNLTRSGYPGSQEYGVILWSGDTDASWENLRKQLTAGVSISATGIPYWTFDIGAFFVKYGEPWYWRGDYPNGYEDEDYCLLYTRWFQLGAFLPIFRAHGTEIPREPWQIGDENSIYYKALKKAIEIRYSLMPYIYTLAFRVWNDDEQMMKPLAFAYPKDKECWKISDQYMLGPSLMICPIISRDGNRQVYFPEGINWYDYFTGEKYEGGSVKTITKAIDEIPVYVPENSLIPTCKPSLNTGAMSDELIIKRFGDGESSFDLYSDDGDGYGYENGEYTITHLK